MAFLVGCAPAELSVIKTSEQGSDADADKLLIVDCLLPGQIKKLGAGNTYVTPRRPAKVTAAECEARGGEYVAYDQANSGTALKVWLSAAQEGDPVAQTYVGEIYEKGLGIAPDYTLALSWYQRAADQGYARAKLNLGYMLEKGLGVKRNLAGALQFYREASGLKDTNIQYTAAVESETLTESSADLQMLRNDAEEERQKLQALRMQMEQTESQMAEKRQALEQNNKKVEQEREELKKAQQMAGSDQQKLKQTEQQLKKRDQDLDKRKKEVVRLNDELENYRKELKLLQGEPPKVAVAGPSIQLVNPALISMRGVAAIHVPQDTKTREIIGRIAAPAGLKSVSVNKNIEKANEQGVFRALIPLNEERTAVRIVAVDQQGKRAEIEFAFLLGKEEPRTADVSLPGKATNIEDNDGHYHALVIGNDAYTLFPKLETAVNDAKTVAALLSEKYGFKTTTLVNANRYTILAALNRLNQKLTDKDNLLVYYAGHGELDKDKSTGYWLPVDADRKDKRKWIPTTAVTDIINALPVKRVLVVADSCYSGALTRSSLPQLEPGANDADRLTWLRAMAKSKARLAFTSGGLKPVADQGGGNHSLFANVLLNVLGANNGILEGQRLYSEVSARLAINPMALQIGQVPQYAPIRHAGHESGEFFFLPRRSG